MTYPSPTDTKTDQKTVILLVDCSSEWQSLLEERLCRQDWHLQALDLDKIGYWLNNGLCIGTVIFGGHFADYRTEQLAELLCQLEQKNIPSFFLSELPDTLLSFQTVFAADLSDIDALIARLETAILLTQNFYKKTSHSWLDSDTAKQLELAGQVQRNFLPSRLPNTDRLAWAALWRPAQWVSGDIYDIARLDENHTGFYLADAVGHSMPAALLTIFIKQATLMRQTQDNQYRIFEPLETLTRLNRRMTQQEFAGCLFATCCCGLLNMHTFELKWARAGHPYPILIRNGKPESLPSRGGLLGVFEQTPLEQKNCHLQVGDKFLVYSDGLEPFIGKSSDDGEFIFKKDFLDLCCLPINQLINQLENHVLQRRISETETDDMTAIGLEIR